MKKWPLPNLDGGKFSLNQDWSERHWFNYREDDFLLKETYLNFELPQGWGNKWPDLPNPDEDSSEFWLDKIHLSNPRNPCLKNTLLGYYLSWHIVGVSYFNENGRRPKDGEELRQYNNSLPLENRFGIHICCKSIENYIAKFSTNGLDSIQKEQYLDYCTYLTLIYVIAHEWGHYRSEVLSFQISDLVKSITGESLSDFAPSFLSYFIHKKEFPKSNFEEIFAEWASLKFGIFNFYMKKPDFASTIKNWPQVEATVKFMLTQAISRPSRIRPYSDIRFWIDFENITRDTVMKRISENKSSVNRSVNDNVLIDKIKSLKKGKIIDLLMHNQMQFSKNHRFNGIIESSRLSYPYEPDSLFYHFGDDECLFAHKSTNSNNSLQLNNPKFSNPSERMNSRVMKVINSLKIDNSRNAFLPIKVFSEILPLDPVYFHV